MTEKDLQALVDNAMCTALTSVFITEIPKPYGENNVQIHTQKVQGFCTCAKE